MGPKTQSPSGSRVQPWVWEPPGSPRHWHPPVSFLYRLLSRYRPQASLAPAGLGVGACRRRGRGCPPFTLSSAWGPGNLGLEGAEAAPKQEMLRLGSCCRSGWVHGEGAGQGEQGWLGTDWERPCMGTGHTMMHTCV